MMKEFKRGQAVRLNEDWHGVPAGTELEFVTRIGPGLYAPGTVEVATPCNADGARPCTLPTANGIRSYALIHERFLEAA